MIYFTSDWHLGESRLGDITKGGFNPFFRPFKNTQEQDAYIISQINKFVNVNDTLYHLGDVLMEDDSFKWLDKIKCENRILVIGNYDEDRIPELKKHFGKVVDMDIIVGEDYVTPINLIHRPQDSRSDMFNIVGHIHGLWKVKRNMVNVGVDAWHFRPVSLKEVEFVRNAIMKGYYDENVFFGEREIEWGTEGD